MVLTLRKKYSVVRPRSQLSNGSGTSDPASGSGGDGATEAPAGQRVEPSDRSVLDRNPWEEEHNTARPRPRTHRSTQSQVHRRLSFDAASGVIVLPEDESWLVEDSDSDDYGELQNSTLSVLQGESEGAEQSSAGGSPGGNKRYSTYYHHPERRKTYTRP